MLKDKFQTKNVFVLLLSLVSLEIHIGQEKYILVSDLDGRVLQGKPNGGADMRTLNASNDFQKWTLIAVGQAYKVQFLKKSCLNKKK